MFFARGGVKMGSTDTSADFYSFGCFRLSADGTLLLRDGVVVPLAPKVLQTLLLLVQRAGTVVRKAELIAAIWPDSFVEDTGLTRNISLLRQALGDEHQHLIATIARIGYRFAGAVERVLPDAGSPNRKERGGRPPVVGRIRELDALRREFERARDGQGGIVALVGEPGIGKTTAADTFLREIGASCLIGIGRCSERFAGAEPHLPILEALDELAATPSVMETLRQKAPTWSRVVSRDLAESYGGDAANSRSTGSQERLMRELTLFLEQASRHRPVMIVLDDLHWADLATVDVLSHLAPRLRRMRALVIVTYRLHELALTGHPFGRLRSELIARQHLREVQVSLLALDDVRDYVHSSFAGADVPADLPAFVFRKTEGNPLFMTDLVRYVRDAGIPVNGNLSGRDLPDSLRGLIERMLQGFDPRLRQLLSIAAVQGYEFDSATLARVSGHAAADVEDLLRVADHVHAIVALVGERELPDATPSSAYRFVHVLYQDALYGSIAPSRRIAWARQIAEALVASHEGRIEAIAGQVAVLFETGREFWQASRHFLLTSRNAARLFAFAAATELADRGFECVRLAPGLGELDRAQRELELAVAKVVPLASVQGYGSADVEELTHRVVRLGETVGDPAATAAGLASTWLIRMVRGNCRAAKQAGGRLITLARDVGDDILLINGHMQSQLACHHLGEFHEAAEHAEAVLSLAACAPHPVRCISVLDPVVASRAESARNLWITGRLSESLTECEDAVALASDLRHPDSLAFAWLFHGWVHGYRGDWRTALRSVELGIAAARTSGSVQTLAWNRCVRGWAMAHIGQIEAGRAELAEAIEASKSIMGQVALPQFSAMMAEVLLLLGEDVAGAEKWLLRAIEVENANDDRYFSAEIHRLLAICLASRGETEAACARLQTAYTVSRSQGARLFELRAALSLADRAPQAGRAALQTVISEIQDPGSWPEIEAARRILN
jgi:DNA-binding winged helix-turn-helix (wHTH) protein/tetratricopeptide (TPR) repeat protein